MSTIYLLSLAALDLSGGATLRPFLPIIAENMGASSLEIGFLFSFYSIFQIIFGPIIGNLSDNYMGRKKLLQFSFFCSSLTPFIIMMVNTYKYNYYVLYLSIIPMAVFRHSQSCIKSIIIDQSKIKIIKKEDDENKNNAFTGIAKWSMSCYLGSTFGPLLISMITDNDKSTDSINMVCISSVSFFIIAFGITSIFINDDNNKKSLNIKSKKFSFNIFGIKFANKEIRNLILYHCFAYFALNLYRAGFILILKNRFEFEMSSIAKIISFKGIIGFIMQFYLSFNNKNDDKKCNLLLLIATLSLSISMILYGLIPNTMYYLIYIILIFEECGQSLFRTSYQTVFANAIKLHGNTQTYVSLIDSLSSINRSVTPIIFASIPEQFKYFMTPILCGLLYLILFLAKITIH